MQILRNEDPRDSLQKASRYELCQVAKSHGISEITYGCGLKLDQMVEILRERGITSITIPERPLGVYKPVVYDADTVSSPGAKIAPVEKAAPVPDMSIKELRSECKRRGIKMARTDNLVTLREKLSG